MTDKVTFAPISSFTNDTTAVTQTNANYTLAQQAIDNTLSRDGTQPNMMNANLDMNSNHILNLPAQISPLEPLRLVDAHTLTTGNITLQPIPTGGVQGQALVKNSGSNFDANWIYPGINLTRAQIASTNSANLPQTFMVNGYATANDLGYGATYTSIGAGPSSTLAIQSSNGTWYGLLFFGEVNVGWFGAKGDNTTDDSAAFNNAIAAVGGNGGSVHVPPARYKAINITLQSNVKVRGGSGGRTTYAGTAVPQITASATGSVFLSAGSNASGIHGLHITGLNAGTPCVGITVSGGINVEIRDCQFDQFADQGILITSGVAHEILYCQTVNCLLNRTRAGQDGTVNISGTDHWVDNCEFTASLNGNAISSPSLFCAAFYNQGSNSFYSNIVGEVSDIGLVIAGANNRLANCRGDTNGGHGWLITGSGAQISNCIGINNSTNSPGTYDDFRVSGVNNLLSNCLTALSTPAHAYNDTSPAGDSNKNYYSNLYVGSGGINDTNGNVVQRFGQSQPRTWTLNATTQDVTNYGAFFANSNTPTTVTTLTGGVSGQEIWVLGDGNTRFRHDGSNFIFSWLGDLVLQSGYWYKFMKHPQWHLVSIHPETITTTQSPDRGDSTITVINKIDFPVQIFNTPLTANRSITLQNNNNVGNNGAAGGYFRVVRTAAATGAFNLTVFPAGKVLAAGQWVDFNFNGAGSWTETASGSL